MTYRTTGPLLDVAYQDKDTGERYIELRGNLNVLGDLKQRGEPVGGGSSRYAAFVALLSQSGTSAPIATVLENTLGGTVVFARVGGAFTVEKTVVFMTGNGISQLGTIVGFTTGINAVVIKTVDATDSFAPVDGRMVGTSIEIRVYE